MIYALLPVARGRISSWTEHTRTQYCEHSEVTVELKIIGLVNELGHFINFDWILLYNIHLVAWGVKNQGEYWYMKVLKVLKFLGIAELCVSWLLPF